MSTISRRTDPYQQSQAKQNLYNQQRLKERQVDDQKQRSNDENKKTSEKRTELDIERKAKVRAADQLKTLDQFKNKDKVTIRSMTWETNEKGELEAKPNVSENLPSSVNLKDSAKDILKYNSPKIDLTGKLAQLKQAFMQNTVQAKSHNFFLSKFAQFKVGLMGQILSTLGVSQEELQKLQKQALEGAEEENIEMMAENLYNSELTELLHGKTRKSRSSMLMYKEIERQLIGQMRLLGKPDQWTNVTILEEKIKQMKKIKEEFVQELMALKYQLDYMRQDTLDV